MIQTPKGQLYIIAAPSGAGKTSLVSALIEAVPELQVSISHTTRPMRQTEQNGENYFFVDQTRFMDMQAAGEFFESAKVFGNFYGTSKKWVNEALNQGIDVILEIDWQGARLIRELFRETVSIFILPPSMAVLRQRLTERASDDLSIIESRMQQASEEISHYQEFDYLVINDLFDDTLEGLRAIILANRLRAGRQELKYRDLVVSLK